MEIENSNFDEKVINNNKLVMVDFFADWCSPCKALSPVLDKLQEKNKEDMELYKVNIEDSYELAQQYSIKAVPTVLFFKNGQIVARSIGKVNDSVLEDTIRQYK